jgi:hypothetical protein
LDAFIAVVTDHGSVTSDLLAGHDVTDELLMPAGALESMACSRKLQEVSCIAARTGPRSYHVDSWAMRPSRNRKMSTQSNSTTWPSWVVPEKWISQAAESLSKMNPCGES